MNLLFLDQFSDLGGAQRCLLDLLPAVLHRGWRVHVAAPGTGPLGNRVEAMGGSYSAIHSGPYESRGKSIRDFVKFPAELPALTREISELIGRSQADIVYVNGPRLWPAAALASRVPLVFHIHSYVGQRYASMLAGIALGCSRARLIASCRYVVEPFRMYLTTDRVDVVYNGVEAMPPKQVSSGTRIGLIGRIAPEKGQLEFVEMAKLLPSSWQFLICGAPLFSDEPAQAYFEKVRTAARDLPVEFTGWREDIGQVLSALDLLVVPSAPYEATTRVILEAYSAGVPVMAHKAGGIPEIVTDGETGFLVADPSPESFAATIRKVIEQRALLEKVARNGHEAWKERYTVRQYQARILNILERVGASARA